MVPHLYQSVRPKAVSKNASGQRDGYNGHPHQGARQAAALPHIAGSSHIQDHGFRPTHKYIQCMDIHAPCSGIIVL